MNFADKLITLRKKQGMSQEQLADRLGVTRQSVSKWESGASVPELAKLVAISEMFKVSMDYLVKDYIEDAAYGQYKSEKQAFRGTADAQENASANTAALEEKLSNLEKYFWEYKYVSEKTIKGVPLVCVHFSRVKGVHCVAKGIIAIGNVAVGVVAIGGISIGVLSAGMISLGLLALGCVAFGLAALGCVAFGALAIGVVAIGVAAIGVSALGAYSGGVVAVGKEVAVGIDACGKTVVGERCTGENILQYYPGISKETVRTFLLEHHPKLFGTLLEVFSWIGSNLK